MTRISNRWATAGAAVMALTFTLGLAAAVSPAEARPAYIKIDGVEGSVKSRQKPGMSVRPVRGTVCCLLPRGRGLLWTQLSSCKKLKGIVRPSGACAQAAKAKDAYFVKVDSETTTQADHGTQRSRGDTTLGDVVVVRELDKSSVKLQEN